MHVIPVIDLKAGCAVHARMGQRDRYRPIKTSLCQGSAPCDVVGSLLKLAPFPNLYVADLDAIENLGDHAAVLHTIGKAHPALDLWVDRGTSGAAEAEAWLGANRGTLVLGSESLDGTAILRALRHEPRVVLSLDFRGDGFAGPGRLLEDVAAWPERVVVMTLARVGAEQGPDLDRVSAIVGVSGRRRVYAAGGVRNAADLAALRHIGASGALVATALHTGALTREEVMSATA